MVKLVKPHFLMVKTIFFLGNPLGHLLQGISASFGSGSRGASVGCGGGKNRGFTDDCLVFFSCFLLCKWWFHMVLPEDQVFLMVFDTFASFHVTHGGFTYSNPPFWTPLTER